MNQSAAPLRIAQFVETLAVGGAESLAVDIAGELAARGHRSHLVVADGGGPLRARVSASVVVDDLGCARNDGGALSPLFLWRLHRRLSACLRQGRIQVLQCHLPMANFLGLSVAARGLCRVFPTVHNTREFDYGTGAARLRRPLRCWAYRRMLERADAMVAVSERVRSAVASDLRLRPEQMARIAVVRNGIHVPPHVDAGRRQSLRRELGVGEDQVLIVGVGRLTPQKGFDMLLDALAHMPTPISTWHSAVAGAGECRGGLEDQIARLGLGGQVTLLGRLENVEGLLSAADIYCLPSRFEGLPLALLEAMAAGLPVVAFSIDGVADVVADGVHGRLAAQGSVSELSGCLAELIGDARIRQSMGRRARDLVAGQYGLSRTVDELEALYRSTSVPEERTDPC